MIDVYYNLKKTEQPNWLSYCTQILHNPLLLRLRLHVTYKGQVVQSDAIFDEFDYLSDKYVTFIHLICGLRASMNRLCFLLFENSSSSLEVLIRLFDDELPCASLALYIRNHSYFTYSELPEITYPQFKALVFYWSLYVSGYKIPDNLFSLAFSQINDRYRTMFDSLTSVKHHVPYGNIGCLADADLLLSE